METEVLDQIEVPQGLPTEATAQDTDTLSAAKLAAVAIAAPYTPIKGTRIMLRTTFAPAGMHSVSNRRSVRRPSTKDWLR